MASIHHLPLSGPLDEAGLLDHIQSAASTTPSDTGGKSVEYEQAGLAVSADWWPRGLGLHLDQAGQRHAFEPPEGASTWLQVGQRARGWASIQGSAGSASPEFLGQLLSELRNHVSGVSDKALSRLPSGTRDLQQSLESLRECPTRHRVSVVTTASIPKFGHFDASESLTPRREVPMLNPSFFQRLPGAREDPRVPTIKGAAAQALGAALHERFDWTRPIKLENGPFEQLARALKGPQSGPSSWSLQVDEEGLNVELMLHAGGLDRSLGVVLKEGAHLDGVRIFRPNPSDDLEGLWSRMAGGYNGTPRMVGRVMVPPSAAVNADRPLAGVDLEGRVMVLAHGRPGDRFNAPLVAGLTPTQLAGQLIEQGLPKAFKGTVFVHSCSSGNGLGRTDGFSHQLQRALAAKGFASLSVAARPGVADGMLGKANVVPSEVVRHAPATLQRTDRLIRNLEAQRQAARTPADAAMYGRLVEQETAYRDRIASIETNAALAESNARIEAATVAAMQGAPSESARPALPLLRRLKASLGKLFGRDRPASQAGVDRHGSAARDDVTFDMARVRDMWGHIGPKPAKAKPPRR